MTSYRIALLPGDGIGPECMDATVSVLKQLESKTPELELEFTSHHAGAERYREEGVTMPDDVLKDCCAADAVLLSAIGLPDVRRPDGTEVQPTMMVGLRRAMGLHSAVRPVKLYPGAPCALRDTGPGIDFIVIRENLEGLFASFGGGGRVGNEVATDTLVVTRAGTSKVVDFAFRLAQRRNGRPSDGKKMVTCVDKANVFRSLAFFREIFFDVASSFTDGLFQPSHGTAPTIAGQNIANPLATILSAAMMLDWLGDKRDDKSCLTAAKALEAAVAKVLSEGKVLTPDIGGKSSTTEVADAVAAALNA